MKSCLIDTNIFFNVWREEKSPLTGKDYCTASRELIDQIGHGAIKGYVCIISLMEIAAVLRRAGMEKGRTEKETEKELNKRLEELNSTPNLRIALPTSIDFAMAWSYMYQNKLTPFDSIIVSSASALEVPIVTRDSTLKTKAKDLVDFYEPEEFLKL